MNWKWVRRERLRAGMIVTAGLASRALRELSSESGAAVSCYIWTTDFDAVEQNENLHNKAMERARQTGSLLHGAYLLVVECKLYINEQGNISRQDSFRLWEVWWRKQAERLSGVWLVIRCSSLPTVIIFNQVHKSQMNKKKRKMTKRSPISFLSSPPVASHPVVGGVSPEKGRDSKPVYK